jgi:PIN domain nuclease of toxin-antitoxin system
MMFDDPRLGTEQRAVLSAFDNAIFVSSISIFEIANKVRIGKLPMAQGAENALQNVCEQFSFHKVDLSFEHSQLAGLLPGPHRDPFDRMLAAQSIIEKMPIMSVDSKLADLGAEVVW